MCAHVWCWAWTSYLYKAPWPLYCQCLSSSCSGDCISTHDVGGGVWGERKLKLTLSRCLTFATLFSLSHWASPRRRNFLWLHKSEALSGISLILSFCPSHRCSGGLIGDLTVSLGMGLHPFICCGSFWGWNWSLGHAFGMNNAWWLLAKLSCWLDLRVQLTSVGVSCSVVSNSVRPSGLQPARLLCPWQGSPGRTTGMGCHPLLQEIFPTQGSNLCLLHW